MSADSLATRMKDSPNPDRAADDSARQPSGGIAGGGEMGALMRSIDWAKTPVGPAESWPPALRTVLSILLTSEHPMFVWWGPELVQFYNDGYRPILGSTKHPAAMGQPGRECWTEIWDVIAPMIDTVFAGGSTYTKDGLLVLDRHGFLEECYFNYAYSPIRDETGAAAGIFVAANETTGRVIGERRLALGRELALRTALDRTVAGVFRSVEEVLAQAPTDLAFALIYEVRGRAARLVTCVGLDRGAPAAPAELTLEGTSLWPLGTVVRSGQEALVEDLDARVGALTGGAWPEPVTRALVLPLLMGADGETTAVLVAGLSPRLRLSDDYRNFLQLLARQIAASVSITRAFEQAKQRAADLAELDRAKTAFFSNVSHEFRTPLTLILGPVEDALSHPGAALEGESLETVGRNSRRLLKLVNTLLDFSRIEAGRAEATFEPADLAALTTDLAAAFRSAIERAGLTFEVDCGPLDEPIYVDRDMWEKIVLNLLSNALKFTFEGSIGVALRVRAGFATLVIRDSGVGIAAAELPRVFDRFHRVEGARSRTHEGTGIGLALVRDLVRLHGGDIAVDSREGKGTTFTVSIPTGTAHLAADRLRPLHALPDGSLREQAFVTEAMGWLPGARDDARSRPAADPPTDPGTAVAGARILLVDDNADMREYAARLLRQHWPVDTAADGVEALALARRAVPSLVLTDVMMPNLDGFGLLRALREDPRTRAVPVVMLSARANEESRVEGLAVGADDYLIKPFSARELVARVKTHLELGELRRAADTERNRLYSLFEQAPAAIAVLRGAALVFELSNPRYDELVQRRDIVGKTLAEVLPELKDQGILEILRRVYTTGERFVGREYLIKLVRTSSGQPQDVYFDFVYDPFRAADGSVEGIMVIAFEVTERVRSAQERERLREERESLHVERERLLIEATTDYAICMLDPAGIVSSWNAGAERLQGHTAEEVVGQHFSVFFTDDAKAQGWPQHVLDEATRVGRFEDDGWRVRKDGTRFWANVVITALRGSQGDLRGFSRVTHDMTERQSHMQRIETLTGQLQRRVTELAATNRELMQKTSENESFVYSVSHDLRAPLVNLQGFSQELMLTQQAMQNLLGDARVPPDIQEQTRALLAGELAESVGFIRNSVQHLGNIVHGLLRLSRVGRIEYFLEPVDTQVLVADILASLHTTVQESGARVRVGSLPVVHADSNALGQVFANLVGNALKSFDAQRRGVIDISASSDVPPVFAIKDNGIGIADDHRSKIFQVFQHVHQEKERGEGMGLAIVQRIVERQNGHIWFESARDVGTTFYFTVAPDAAVAGATSERAAR